MIDGWRTSSMVMQLVKQMQNTQIFLRMAAIELRRLADQVPDIEAELRHLAEKLDADAQDLVAAMPKDQASVASRPDP